MPKLRSIIVTVVIAFVFWHFYGSSYKTGGVQGVVDKARADVQAIAEHPLVRNTWHSIKLGLGDLKDEAMNKGLKGQGIAEKPDLRSPDTQDFSVHNVEIGDAKADVEAAAGSPKRSSFNEYGTEWYTYHEGYHNFFMAAYDEQGRAAALYTNQDLLSSKTGIKLGTPKDEVRQLGYKPLEAIRKGLISYRMDSKGEYDLFLIDGNYVTIFYDTQQGDMVTAILIVSEKFEKNKENIYGAPSEELKEGYEQQLFDVTNAARVQHGLNALSWNEPVQATARGHSSDMADKHYFDHTNLEGKSPFDRMEEDGIAFSMAGENIAKGQFNSIFAHEGLMNSPGHRKNILLPEYRALGTGVAFNETNQPYFTENFLK